MSGIDLSYVICTHNRLVFLQILLSRLIENIQPREEIIVVDGNSDDGTKEYLSKLYKDGKIHQFISEPDRNQAHGWNKGFLMAKGQIIKKLIDDDVFCYKAIRKCAGYMLKDPSIDVLISNDLGCSLDNPQDIQKFSRLTQYKKWRSGLVPSFTFGDVHMLIRRSSLSHTGLYNTAYIMMDWEFSLRISYLKANIAYYNGYNALSVAHLNSVSALKNKRLVEEQGKRAEFFYEYAGDTSEISNWSKFKISAGKILNYNKNKGSDAINKNDGEVAVNALYAHLYQHLSDINDLEEYSFL